MINRKILFTLIRDGFYSKGMDQGVVDGINTMLDEWERRKLTDLRWLAYMMGTVYYEADKTFQPVKEGYYVSKDEAKAEAWRKKNLRYYPWYGRGWIQLTWKYNYEKQSKKLGIDLLTNPDKALELPIAAQIAFNGMIDGDFTGKKFSDYFNSKTEDWVNARRIINGLDKAQTYANASKKFYSYLKQADSEVLVQEPAPPSKGGDPVSPNPEGQKDSILTSIIKGVLNVIRVLFRS